MRPHQLRWLREFWTEYFGNLEKKIEKSSDDQKKAISDAAQTSDEERRKIPGVIARIAVAMEAANSDVETYEKPQRKKEYTLQKWSLLPNWITAVATVLAFVAAAVYACIANRQLVKMDATYSEIQKQTADADTTASAAKSQTAMLKAQLLGSQGAVLHFSAQMLNSGQLSINISGASDASVPIKPSLTFTVTEESFDGTHQFGRPLGPFTPDIPKQIFDTKPMHQWTHQWDIPWADIPTDPTGPPKWTEGWPGKITKLSGTLLYDDGFGDPPTKLLICQKYVRRTSFKNNLGGTESIAGYFFPCDEAEAVVRSGLYRHQRDIAQQEKK